MTFARSFCFVSNTCFFVFFCHPFHRSYSLYIHSAKRWQGHSNQQKEAARKQPKPAKKKKNEINEHEEHEEDGELLSEDELEFGVEEEDEEEEGES